MSIHTCLINNLILNLWCGHREISIVQPLVRGKNGMECCVQRWAYGRNQQLTEACHLEMGCDAARHCVREKCFFPPFPCGVVIKTLWPPGLKGILGREWEVKVVHLCQRLGRFLTAVGLFFLEVKVAVSLFGCFFFNKLLELLTLRCEGIHTAPAGSLKGKADWLIRAACCWEATRAFIKTLPRPLVLGNLYSSWQPLPPS